MLWHYCILTCDKTGENREVQRYGGKKEARRGVPNPKWKATSLKMEDDPFQMIRLSGLPAQQLQEIHWADCGQGGRQCSCGHLVCNTWSEIIEQYFKHQIVDKIEELQREPRRKLRQAWCKSFCQILKGGGWAKYPILGNSLILKK